MKKEVQYQKLVRDYIPRLIKAQKEIPFTRILSEEEFAIQLKHKLQEEVIAFLQAADGPEQIEEMADIIEVLYALGALNGYCQEEIEEIRLDKKKEKGGFDQRIFLEKKEIIPGL